MRVLVTYASRSGATDAIARRVADRLRARGVAVHVVAVGEVDDVEAYDAVVAGGGTTGTHWLRPARRFVQRHEEQLSRRPVWLFGSAPQTAAAAGDVTRTTTARPREFDEFHRLVEAVDEAVFVRADDLEDQPAGLLVRLRRRLVGDGAHNVPASVHDEARVDAWTDEIADRLEQVRRDRAIDAVHEMHTLEEMSGSESGGA